MSSTPFPFVPGLELSRRLFTEAVRPVLTEHFPRLRYTAALVGSGSEVLGYDTARSTDHDWGPRLLLMVDGSTAAPEMAEILARIDHALPPAVGGIPTRFGDSELEPGTPVLEATPTGRGAHGITLGTTADFLRSRLGLVETSALDPAAWVTMSEQHLLEITAGGVWHDSLGQLTAARHDLAWYPEDVWRYRLAAGWQKIAQHEAFIGRAAEVGDDLGSQLVALAIVRDIMQLAFLIERRYAPYEKWFGTAFSRLDLASTLSPVLDRARFAGDARHREQAVVEAGVVLAGAQNDLGLCEAVDPTPRQYFQRPFTVLDAGRFASALTEQMTDERVLALPRHLGGLDQYVDSTDGREWIDLHRAIRAWLRDDSSEPG